MKTKGDTPDQKRLREVISMEVEAVMRKHDVGGVVLLVSRESASWHMTIPPWVGIIPDPVHGIRIRFGSKDPDPDKANNTMHFIGMLRDMGHDLANFWGRLWRQVESALKAQGATVEHNPVLGAGRPIDPLRGKVD